MAYREVYQAADEQSQQQRVDPRAAADDLRDRRLAGTMQTVDFLMKRVQAPSSAPALSQESLTAAIAPVVKEQVAGLTARADAAEAELAKLRAEIAPVVKEEHVMAYVAALNARADAAEAELAKLRGETAGFRKQLADLPPALDYKEVWSPGVTYQRNNVVSFSGGMWVATRDTDMKPGAGADNGWRLAVKSARNGRSAYELARAAGFGGTEAEWLISLRGKDARQAPSGTAESQQRTHSAVAEPRS